jgi:hypothetical protein
LAWTFGIGGDIAIWASSYFRGTGSFAVRNSLNYSLFFFGNLGFFTALLWGKTDGDIERGGIVRAETPDISTARAAVLGGSCLREWKNSYV